VCSFREWAVTELSRRGREGITSFRFHGTEERPEMKALVYHGPGKRSWEEKPKPVIQDSSDAIVRILRTTICGSDLHILKGHVPSATDGRILGHEGLGIVEEAGPSVSSVSWVLDGLPTEYAHWVRPGITVQTARSSCRRCAWAFARAASGGACFLWISSWVSGSGSDAPNEHAGACRVT
jgi:hypothetical protein